MKNKTIHELTVHHEHVLRELLENVEIPAPRIREAITYALFSGGKRLRPVLVYLCGNILELDQRSLDLMAAAIEFTHCYSLIHDDLPAMDNDDFRRGKPSCHRAFDEATAILAGDALQILAIDILASHLPVTLDMQQVVEVIRALARASGPAGMVSGQSLDLSELANATISETKLREIHMLKTGAIISSCINMVIAAGNPPPSASDALRQFAHHLGLVFQMQDDYLDKYNNSELGKGRASDEANHKTTFASLFKQEELSNLIDTHFEQAQDALIEFGPQADGLRDFMHQLHRRTAQKPCV